MLKAGRTQWLLLILSTFLLAPVFLINARLLQPSVQAASRGIEAKANQCTQKHYSPTFGSNAIIDKGVVLCSPLIVVNGTAAINGDVHGNVITFNSQVVIGGSVTGNIHVFGGTLTLESSSQVHGDIHLYGGDFARADDSQVAGSVSDSTQDLGKDWLVGGWNSYSFPFWSILTWIILGLLLTWILPEHVMIVRMTIVDKARRSFVIGLLSVLLAPLILVILVALILTIPLAFIVGLGLIAAWTLGAVAFGGHIGDHIMRRIAPDRNTRVMQVVVGLAVLALAGSLPIIGWLINLGVGLVGLGAVFLSRFGTRLYGPPRNPLTL